MRFLYILFFSVVISIVFGCTEEATQEQPTPTPATQTTSTDTEGAASLVYSNRTVTLRVVDFDTGLVLPNITVSALELDDGFLVWATDNSGSYYPNAIFIPFALQNQASIQLYTTQSDNSFGLNYVSEPTGFTELFSSTFEKSCISGTLSDALLAISGNNVGSLDGIIVRIAGAPAETVDKLSIYLGFSGEIAQTAYMNGDLDTIFNDLGGILATDSQSFCWTVVGNEIPPLLEVSVARVKTNFDITHIDALEIYPYSTSQQALFTNMFISWDGSPNISANFTAIFTAVCAPDVDCVSGEYSTIVENPVERPFGCWSTTGSPSTITGFSTWQVVLRDVDGFETPPATFTTRCGHNVADANSLQWGSKFWSPANIFQNTLGAGWTEYKFENYPNAPVPNLDILDFSFIVDDTNTLQEVNLNYHNTGVDPQSLVLPPKYVYKLDCGTGACESIVFDAARQIFILDKTVMPPVPRVPNSNNFADSSVRITGNFVW